MGTYEVSDQAIFQFQEIHRLKCTLEKVLNDINVIDDIILSVADQDASLTMMDTLIIGLRNEVERLLLVINSKLDKT